MSAFDNPDQLRLLQELLNNSRDTTNNASNSDSDDDRPTTSKGISSNMINMQVSKDDGGNVASALESKTLITKSPYIPIDDPVDKLPDSFQEWEELQEEDDDQFDTRKRPEYTITYRQAIGTEDIFLQMGNRTNATASCEDLIVDIQLSDDTTPADKMRLDITETEVDFATSIYRLKLPLEHKVLVDSSRAKYNPELHKLSLTLRLQRELDIVNF